MNALDSKNTHSIAGSADDDLFMINVLPLVFIRNNGNHTDRMAKKTKTNPRLPRFPPYYGLLIHVIATLLGDFLRSNELSNVTVTCETFIACFSWYATSDEFPTIGARSRVLGYVLHGTFEQVLIGLRPI